ncbi:unnamed protein product, partial [Ixodes pacificus]
LQLLEVPRFDSRARRVHGSETGTPPTAGAASAGAVRVRFVVGRLAAPPPRTRRILVPVLRVFGRGVRPAALGGVRRGAVVLRRAPIPRRGGVVGASTPVDAALSGRSTIVERRAVDGVVAVVELVPRGLRLGFEWVFDDRLRAGLGGELVVDNQIALNGLHALVVVGSDHVLSVRRHVCRCSVRVLARSTDGTDLSSDVLRDKILR